MKKPASLSNQLSIINQKSSEMVFTRVYGIVNQVTGFLIEATGLKTSVGTLCHIDCGDNQSCSAEVIGFTNDKTFLMAYEETFGIIPGSKIHVIDSMLQVPVGMSMLGRIINGRCHPLDNKGILDPSDYYPLYAKSINPIDRNRITAPLDVGIRAINSFTTVGEGQRLGIFAGSGVGKSVLLGMMTSFTEADVVVVGLIGERGREVKEFIEENIGEKNLEKSVIVASPIDTSPLERANGALVTTSIAEYFRDQGMKVLLILDSLTRYAQALRQIYLILGEMPSSKGYTPTVFAKISKLVERTGHGTGNQGSITAFYTVLSEGDDMNDPVADHARSILDGHIVLSRKLADSGHYPAIDISASISRVMPAVISQNHLDKIMQFKQLYAAYQDNQDLIKMGMYHKGTDKAVDIAIDNYPNMIKFLQQRVDEPSVFNQTINQLMELISINE